MARAIGLDFGTTNTVLALCEGDGGTRSMTFDSSVGFTDSMRTALSFMKDPVMGAQALSGIAKDLNKMSAKSALKLLVPGDQQSQLYRWVALLTGSKNALKGVGFFLGGALLALLGFSGAVLLMAGLLGLIWLASLYLLKADLGKAKAKPKAKSKSKARK